jgi:hypothetical protein
MPGRNNLNAFLEREQKKERFDRIERKGGKHMATYSNLEETWGIAATYSEHHITDHICYSVDGQVHTGTIIWVCAPFDPFSGIHTVRYVVQLDTEAISPDLVCPGYVLIDKAEKQQVSVTNPITGSELEQALIEMLSTLAIPIIVKQETDDDGYPFYVWHIGPSTSAQPFGQHVGIDRQFIGALKLALKTLIRHAERKQ